MQALSAASHLSKHPLRPQPRQPEAKQPHNDASEHISLISDSDDPEENSSFDTAHSGDGSDAGTGSGGTAGPAASVAEPAADAAEEPAAPLAKAYVFPNELPDVAWPANELGLTHIGLNESERKQVRQKSDSISLCKPKDTCLPTSMLVTNLNLSAVVAAAVCCLLLVVV